MATSTTTTTPTKYEGVFFENSEEGSVEKKKRKEDVWRRKGDELMRAWKKKEGEKDSAKMKEWLDRKIGEDEDKIEIMKEMVMTLAPKSKATTESGLTSKLIELLCS